MEYPTGSCKFNYESAKFEAIEPPPVPAVLQLTQQLGQALPPLPPGVASPYFERPCADTLTAPAPTGTVPSTMPAMPPIPATPAYPSGAGGNN